MGSRSRSTPLPRHLLPAAALLAVAALTGACSDGASTGGDLPVPPESLPLVALEDFEYQGAFRLPAAEYGASSINYSEGPMALNPENGSLFVVGHSHHQAIAEFAMPALVNSATVGDLAIADAPLQAFATVLDRVDNPQSIDRIGGLALLQGSNGPELLVNAYEYYDAPGDNSHTSLVLRDPDDLAGSAVDGYYALDGVAHASGWISPIPAEWREALGGTHITGSSSGMPIISRLSVGPSAFVFDPFAIVGADTPPGPVATTALLDFNLDNALHDDLSNEAGENDVWTHLSRAIYGFIPPGTRTYVTLGYSGGHATGVCYKCTPAGASQDCGGYCANNVDDYSHFYWLWDVNDLADVAAGDAAPYEVRPYAYGEFPTPFETRELGGGAYDPVTGLLYLNVQRADREQGTYANPPIVVAYRLR